MGLFDKVFGSRMGTSTELNAAESMLGVMVATMGADGHIAREELDGLSANVNRMNMFKTMTQGQFNDALRKVVSLLDRRGAPELMQLSTPNVPQDYRATAFAIALDMVLADGVVDREEERLIDGLQAALSVPDDDAKKILEVLLLKNKP